MVRVDRHVGVFEEYLQPGTPVVHVGQCLREWIAGQQSLPLELLVDPGEELLDARLAVGQAMQSLGLAAQLLVANCFLDLVEHADLAQGLGRARRLGILRLEECPARMGPTLGVLDAGLLGVARVRLVAVTQQHRARRATQAQGLLDMLVAARLEVREADFVVIAVDRPEERCLHLAAAGLAGLDRRLVHRDDVARADRVQLRLVDRLEQLRGLLHELGQPGTAEVEAGIDKTLVLAIQRQVPAELVQHHADDEAHVGAAAFDDAHGGRRAVQRLRVAALDHRAHILEHDKAAGALREAVADLLADDLVLLRRQALSLGAGHDDGLDGHLGLVEERRADAVVGKVFAGLAALVRRHVGARIRPLGRHRQFAHDFAEVHLLCIVRRREAFALATKHLTFEPLHLALEFVDLRGLRLQDPSDLRGLEAGHLHGIRDAGRGGRHATIVVVRTHAVRTSRASSRKS